jgi:hypothetical protein
MKEKLVDVFATSEAALEQAELLCTVASDAGTGRISRLIRAYLTVYHLKLIVMSFPVPLKPRCAVGINTNENRPPNAYQEEQEELPEHPLDSVAIGTITIAADGGTVTISPNSQPQRYA